MNHLKLYCGLLSKKPDSDSSWNWEEEFSVHDLENFAETRQAT
jgi:hypothetical protein